MPAECLRLYEIIPRHNFFKLCQKALFQVSIFWFYKQKKFVGGYLELDGHSYVCFTYFNILLVLVYIPRWLFPPLFAIFVFVSFENRWHSSRRLTALVPRARRLGVSGYGNLTLQLPDNSPPPPVKTEKKKKHCEGTYNRRPHARVEEPIWRLVFLFHILLLVFSVTPFKID